MNSDYFQIDFSQAELYTSLCEGGIEQVKNMMPNVLSSNINIFNKSYSSEDDQRVEIDVLRSALVKYYRSKQNMGVCGEDLSHYKEGFRYDFSETIIPKHWINAENYPRPIRNYSFSDESCGISDDFLDYLQNPNEILDFNFDDIFYNLQNLE